MDTVPLEQGATAIYEAANMLSFELFKAGKGNQTSGTPRRSSRMKAAAALNGRWVSSRALLAFLRAVDLSSVLRRMLFFLVVSL
jgi:hypothetical protein